MLSSLQPNKYTPIKIQWRDYSLTFCRYAKGMMSSGRDQNNLIQALYKNPLLGEFISKAIVESVKEHINSKKYSPFTIYLDDFSEKIFNEISSQIPLKSKDSDTLETIKDLVRTSVFFLNSEHGSNIKLLDGRQADICFSSNGHRFKDVELDEGLRPFLDAGGRVNTLEVGKATNASKIRWTYIEGIGYIPIHPGVMKAQNSTSSFLRLVDDMSERLKGKRVFQIGPNHGAITAKLMQYASDVIAPDILPNAVKNTKETVRILGVANDLKLKVYHGDLQSLEFEAAYKGPSDFLFFNCPIFRGEDNVNSMAGEDFELVKRTIKMLPSVLKEEGEAYLLVGYPRTEKAKEFLWTSHKLNVFLKKEMPGWTAINLPQYESPYNEHGTYGIVKIRRCAATI